MKSYSVRLDPQDLARLRAFAEARRLKPSTALRQLVRQGLRAAEAPAAPKPAPPPAPSAERGLIEQCLSLLRLLSLYQVHAFHLTYLKDHTIGSSLRRFQEAQAQANQTLDGDPALFGRARFRVPETPAKTQA